MSAPQFLLLHRAGDDTLAQHVRVKVAHIVLYAPLPRRPEDEQVTEILLSTDTRLLVSDPAGEIDAMLRGEL